MTGDSDSLGSFSPASVSVGTVQAERDVFVANVIQVYQVIKEGASPGWEIQREVPRTAVARAALALQFLLNNGETCFYLGSRYGLTPHSPVSPEWLEGFAPGVRPPATGSLSTAVSWLAGLVGMTATRRYLAEHYGRLDQITSDAATELSHLAAVAAGRTIVTGSYSARIQNVLGPALTIIHGDGQLGYGLPPESSKRSRLLMLHGSEQDFQNALVAKDDVLTYREHRPALTAAVSGLLLSPWIVLGAEEKTDSTFHLLVGSASRKLEGQQRPLFVIDPRPEEVVEIEWPRAALRHVRLTPAEFLSMALRTE